MVTMNVRMVLILVLPALAQAQTGTIRGTVTSQDGKPVGGAVVSYARIPVFLTPAQGFPRYRLAPGELAVNYWVVADGNGDFAVDGLPAGKYLLCVEVPGLPFLNPCKWSTSVLAVLASGATVPVRIPLNLGVYLKVRIDDPQGLLPPTRKSPLDFPHLSVGVVFGSGAYHALTEVSVDSAGRNFQIAVPAAIPLQLYLSSHNVKLADSSGSPIDNQGTRVSFQAIASQDRSFRFQVTGAVAP